MPEQAIAEVVRLGHYRGYWCATWPGPKGTQRRSLRLLASVDRGEAERALEDFRLSLAPGGAATVSDLMAAYLKDRCTTALSPDSLRYSWKRLQPFFGHLRPEHIDREKCRSYMAGRRSKGASDGTIRKELGCLRAGLRWARPRNAEQLFESIELPPMPPPKTRHLTHDEFRRLLVSANGKQKPQTVEDVGNHVRLFIVLALTTGGRKEALLQLTWDRVDLERGMIQLGDGTRRIKGRATVPMTEQARAELLKAKKAALTDHVIEWAGKPVVSIKTGFNRAVARAGLGRDVTPHVLRHTAAVWMAEDGHSMNEIAQYLGHSNTTVTEKVYARFSPTYLRKASEALKW